MPKQLILILLIVLVCAWFFIVERQSVFEKIFIIVGLAVIYATYRVLTGVPTSQIFIPIINFFRT